MGDDHVVWGTDSVWYGSPQWQIEAMRRIEIPEDMQKAHGFAALGAGDGAVKSRIFSQTSLALYGMEDAAGPDAAWRTDALSAIKAKYVAAGREPSNEFHGFIRRAAGEA